MSDSTFRTASDTPSELPQPNTPRDDTAVEQDMSDLAPVSDDALLEALNLEEAADELPVEAQQDIKEINQYIKDVMKEKGRSDTSASFNKTLDEVKEMVGLDEQASPDVVIERVGALIKSYKAISFVRDAKERRSLFMKLAKMDSPEAMDKLVFEEMNKRQVWRTP